MTLPARAVYHVEENDFLGMRTVLRDCDVPGRPSITNDAEAVVAELLKKGTIKPGGRLFYYDTEGTMDELVYDARGFLRFAPGPRP